MDHVLARIKGLRKSPYRKLVSDHTLFGDVAVIAAACVPYDPDHNLDEDSWFKVENFSQQPYCLELLKKAFDSKDYNELTGDQFPKISYLIAIQGENFHFQKVTPSLFIKKKMIAFGEVANIEEDGNRLVINSTPDATYLTASDTLVFRSLSSIAAIFVGIDELYKEATQEEVEDFLEESFIELTNEYCVDSVSRPNRKRIALAMATLDAMSEEDREGMLSYIESYCEDKLTYDKENKKFEVATDDDLKLLLYGIEQRFYTTPIGQEKRLANSVMRL